MPTDYNSSYTGPQIDEAVGNALNPDTTPTENSDSLITSGGVYSGLSDKLPADGTAVGSYRMMYVHSITGAAGWYHFLDISTTAGQSRVIQLLIDNGQSSVSGILRIYMYRTGSGSLAETSIVNWMTTTIPINYVRWTYSNGVTSFYIYKTSTTDRAITFTVLSAINRAGTNLDPSILEWDNVAVSEPTTATPATANILNNAATATNALNDGNGDQIDTTYLKTTDTTKAPAKAGVYYGVCNSLESDITKTVTINEITSLYDGLQINVLFANSTISSSQLSLQLNNFNGASIRTSNDGSYAASGEWTAGEVVLLTYNQLSNYWIIRSHASTSYYGVTKLNSAINSSSISTAATPSAVKTAYDLAASKSKLVRFTAQAVSVASGAEIFRITDSDITTDTEVVSVEFADPSYITAGGSWTSYTWYVAFTGTCTAATTADVILKI